ncbi:unnamed protein product [Nesidiocoris tenuis]|uniref:Uncharacterized protein n=1 Tax=Nesidiocoris tenuis TaxID=355587 RepID=A0A6H5GDR0_9HEMI|nr:unnamed protein product [Nesidiocoris tenuis]
MERDKPCAELASKMGCKTCITPGRTRTTLLKSWYPTGEKKVADHARRTSTAAVTITRTKDLVGPPDPLSNIRPITKSWFLDEEREESPDWHDIGDEPKQPKNNILHYGHSHFWSAHFGSSEGSALFRNSRTVLPTSRFHTDGEFLQYVRVHEYDQLLRRTTRLGIMPCERDQP